MSLDKPEVSHLRPSAHAANLPSSMPLDTSAIAYRCQRCGNCCRWPGDIIVTEAEIAAIAVHLRIDEGEFIQRFTRLSANRMHLSLKEREDGSCVFLEGSNDCVIHPVKPDQCRGFPNRWRFDGWRELCEAIEVENNI